MNIILKGGPKHNEKMVVEDGTRRYMFPVIADQTLKALPWTGMGPNQFLSTMVYERTNKAEDGLVVFEFRE